jgi:hypothetical protein
MDSLRQLPAPKIAGLLRAPHVTHEQFIGAVADIAIARICDKTTRDKLRAAKLTYGIGERGLRGVTWFGKWHSGSHQDFIEVCAAGEESPLQLAGTTIHELGHVLAGCTAGHSKLWKQASEVLGLAKAEAAGQCYAPEHFAPEVLDAITRLSFPTDGVPAFNGTGSLTVATKFRPCPLGIGTRGGKSRGAGSGSRLRLYQCSCGVKVRVARDNFNAHCDDCGTSFVSQ